MKKKVLVFLIMAIVLVMSSGNQAYAKPMSVKKAQRETLQDCNDKLKELSKVKYNKIPKIHPKSIPDNLNQVSFSADYEPDTHSILVNETIRYLNSTNEDLDKIYFNAYGNDKTFRKNHGSVKISEMKVDGEDTTYHFYKKVIRL